MEIKRYEVKIGYTKACVAGFEIYAPDAKTAEAIALHRLKTESKEPQYMGNFG